MVEKVNIVVAGFASAPTNSPQLFLMMDPKQLNDLIRKRRSTFVNQFIERQKIPDEIIWQMLENANRAPNHGQTEPWRFTVFTGEGLNRLATFQSELYKKEAGYNFKEDKYQKLMHNPLRCSHIIAIGMKKSESKIPEIEEIEAVACAVQNIYLSMTAYQLGGYWTTGGITYFESAKEFFGLGDKDRLLGFFYLGYVAIQSPHSRRLPIKEKVTWIGQ